MLEKNPTLANGAPSNDPMRLAASATESRPSPTAVGFLKKRTRHTSVAPSPFSGLRPNRPVFTRSRFAATRLWAVSLCLLGVFAWTQVAFAIRGGTTVPAGQLDPVVSVSTTMGNCTGTLITRDSVLTAAHCLCGRNVCPTTLAQCATRATVTFTNVLPVGSTTPGNVSIGANAVVHPNYCSNGGWLTNDYAILQLDQPADQVAQVSPIYIEDAAAGIPEGDPYTIVGYGPTHQGSTTNCLGGGAGIKRSGATALDQYKIYPDPSWGATLIFNDLSVGGCPGDSGGPALNPAGRVVGVLSHGDDSTNSNYDPTDLVWDWLSRNACGEMDPSSPDASFCNNPLCPCATGAGDCDSDSQCIAGDVCVPDVGGVVGLPSEYDVCWAPGQLATMYRGPAYGGVEQAFPVGIYRASQLTVVGNDTISSLIASPGLMIRLCSENGGWGTCQSFSGEVAYVGSDLDNRTSYVEVRPAVTVYRGSDFSGIEQTFRVGTHRASDLTLVGNDTISSLIAAPGLSVRLCSENGGWGTCTDFSGEVAYVGTDLDNRTSYVDVRPAVTVYRDADYRGVEQAFSSGTYGAADLTVVGNDTVSSLITAPGVTARLCSENGGWGTCQVFDDRIADVGRDLDNRTSYIDVGAAVTVYTGKDLHGLRQAFRVGAYGAADLTVVGNDTISSLIAAPGLSVRLCSENGGWGTCQSFSGEVLDVGSVLDNRTSNIEVLLLNVSDSDGDGVADNSDNCVSVPNPTQSDSNADGFGNACDSDYDGDLIVGLGDFGLLSAGFGLTCSDPAFDPDLDANDDCAVGLSDYGVLSSALGSPPGPSGLDCAGTVPCTAP